MFYVWISKYFPVKKDLVLLESNHCKDFVGNPFYIAEHLSNNTPYSSLRMVIVCPRRIRGRLRDQFFGAKGLKFCTSRSLFYVYYLAVAEYLINDTTFPIFFSRREDQRYLNTWHGTPLKAMGRRNNKELFLITNVQRNFLHATHLLAPNRQTEEMFLDDYMLRNFWRGQIVRSGYPRNDILYANILEKFDDSKFLIQIAFMPTWRGKFSERKEESEKQILDLLNLFNKLDLSLPQTCRIWVRLHPLIHGQVDLTVYRHISAFPANIEPYEHLSKCDALVTDYSSVMFDFACSGKPILLYLPDLTQYQEERDFSIDPLTLPFEQVTTVEQLLDRIGGLGGKPRKVSDAYQCFQMEYCKYDTGHSTQSVCASFFLEEASVEVRNVRPDSSRLKVLLFGGAFLNNGMTTSLKTLLTKLDLGLIDLMLWVSADTAKLNAGNWFNTLDNQISFIPTRNWLPVDPFDAIRIAIKDIFSRTWKTNDTFATSIWQREWRRHFGSAEFDTVVHFTGYERSVSLLLQGIDAYKVVYAHNDMAQEINTGRVGDARSLQLAFELADRIATVREGVEDSYCKQFFDVSAKVIYVPNTLNLNCRARACEPLFSALRDDTEPEIRRVVENSLNRDSEHRFINLARFSPEKGQIRLIAAFERVWAEFPTVQLFIVGGHGTSYAQVADRAAKSTAASAIFVLHGSGNPFPLVAQMNSLILSSFYEGRPMVLSEAFELGLDVISTDIPGPSELLNQGYGLVVENSEDGLVEGMRAALRGEVPRKAFDFEAHNKFAVEQFLKVITPENFPVQKVRKLVN